jgi:hypothetical protein
MQRNHRVATRLAVCIVWLMSASESVHAQIRDVPIDTAATNALGRMGRYLRSLQAFQVHGDVITETVLLDGQKVQLTKTADLVTQRPNRLRMTVDGDRENRVFLYDGTNFTLFAPRLKYYATMPAPPTIGELITQLEGRYDIDLPLVDLFRWGTPDSEENLITAADDIGPANCAGVTCEQYSFRQPGMDWQVWIQTGDFPLPLKVVLTTTTDDARPQYSVVYRWNLAPSFNNEAFVFDAPEDASKIAFVTATAYLPTASK